MDAGFCVAAGLATAAAARPVGRAVRLPAPVVALTGVATAGWGMGVGVGAVAEDWMPPTRHAAVVNMLTAAGLVGLAAARGSLAGRLGTLAAAGAVGAFAYGQVRALVEERGPVIA